MIIFPLEPVYDPLLEPLASEAVVGLDAAMADPLAVKWLNLRGNLMSEIGPIRIPDELSRLQNLEVLEVEQYSAVRLTATLAELPALHTIILLGNEFAPQGMILGRHLSDVPRLRALYVDGFFPLELTLELASGLPLRTLWLEDCSLEGVQFLAALTELRELSIDVTTDACMAALLQMKQLERLRLFVDAELPQPVRELKLRTLALTGLRTAALPDWLGEMETLEELDLCGSGVASLPDGFAALKRLEIRSCPLGEQVDSLRRRFPGVEMIPS